MQRGGKLVGEPPPLLTSLFATAPGLRFFSGVSLAMPDFLVAPMNMMPKMHYGADSTVERCIHQDMAIFDPGMCAMEVAWNPSALPTVEVAVLSRDGRLFSYVSHTTEDGLHECSWTCDEFIERFFAVSGNIITESLRHSGENGRVIAEILPGAAVRKAYDHLTLREQVVIGLRAAFRVFLGGTGTFDWKLVGYVLDSCIASVRRGDPIGTEILASAASIVSRPELWLAEADSWARTEALTVVCHIPAIIRAWNGEVQELRYPDYRVRDFSRGPIYRWVDADIRFLRQCGESAGVSSAFPDYVQLLDSPL